MPLFKNLKDEVCQVLEPEVALVVKAGWKQLNEAEEAAYREGLKVDHALTSAAAIEEARVKAGLYSLVNEVVNKGEKAATDAVDTAKKATAKKPAAAKKPSTTSKPSDTAASTDKPAETASNTASEGTSTDATK
jgi:hypothetical protein